MPRTTEDERRSIERGENWEQFNKYLPKLTIPDGCQIKVIPPFCGAIIRFVIYKGDKSVSVYFDAYERLGLYGGGEYWEAYPIDDNNNRYDPDKFDEMMADISRELSKP